MNLDAVDGLSEGQVRTILKSIFSKVMEPAFCALPQRELNLFLLETMREAGVLESPASLEHLMGDLGITRARARSLMFDLHIRAAREAEDGAEQGEEAN
ncbi:hypothetical protein [Actibacterium sp. MT2.3-13A]|uniref:hypothetical protein n=1 Tax=Actibacterium sp. MT2.3-13A TaxID=2828332 RepID=UPI001BA643BB|nr:hypothetical protein [Actibacterium sp. MT2.3-13A]